MPVCVNSRICIRMERNYPRHNEYFAPPAFECYDPYKWPWYACIDTCTNTHRSTGVFNAFQEFIDYAANSHSNIHFEFKFFCTHGGVSITCCCVVSFRTLDKKLFRHVCCEYRFHGYDPCSYAPMEESFCTCLRTHSCSCTSVEQWLFLQLARKPIHQIFLYQTTLLPVIPFTTSRLPNGPWMNEWFSLPPFPTVMYARNINHMTICRKSLKDFRPPLLWLLLVWTRHLRIRRSIQHTKPILVCSSSQSLKVKTYTDVPSIYN